jgi:hypothetical protein
MPPTLSSRRRLTEAAIVRTSSICTAGLLLVLGACGPERTVEPTPLVETAPVPDLRAQAFKVTIDTRSGQVEVTPPSAGTATLDGSRLSPIGGPSFSRVGGPNRSLIGGEAVGVNLTPCTFSAIPDRSKRRCTMALALRNVMAATDLVTPTLFPQPPQGTNGILVFPFSPTAFPGGEEVVPSPDWDLGPTNFFNDNTCSGSGKTDCFRYEVFPSPLYAREVTPSPRNVGFDIPASADWVTAYFIVAADLRDNPVQVATLRVVPELCGLIDYSKDPPLVIMPNYPGDQLLYTDGRRTTFCTFSSTLLPPRARIVSAILRVFSWGGISPTEVVLAQRVDWGSTLEPADLQLPTLNSERPFTIEDPSYAGAYYMWYVARGLKDAMQAAVDEGQTTIQFRIVPGTNSPGALYFYGPVASQNVRPQLVVQYSLP